MQLVNELRSALAGAAVVTLAAGSPADSVKADTLTISADELEETQELRDSVSDLQDGFEIDLSSPEALLETFESGSMLELSDIIPEELLADMSLGDDLQEDADLAWGARIDGTWSEEMQGDGTLVSWNLDALGDDGLAGRAIQAQLDLPGRDFPLSLGTLLHPDEGSLPESGGEIAGIGIMSNHLFDGARTIGHGDPSRLGDPGWAPLEDMRDDYLFTEFENVRIEFERVTRSSDGETEPRWLGRWSARVVEKDEGGDVTGRVGRISGWICDHETHARDQELCEREPFQLTGWAPSSEGHESHSETFSEDAALDLPEVASLTEVDLALSGLPDNENVNPQEPGILLEFNRPADPASLAANVEIATRDADDDILSVEGDWRDKGDGKFAFVPYAELHSGTRYEVEVSGGPDGVRSADGTEHLDNSASFDFTTLLDLKRQSPEWTPDQDQLFTADENAPPSAADPRASGEPVGAHVYQTVEDPELVPGKPALTRIWVDWEKHKDIHPDWQPDTFYMRLWHNPAGQRVEAIHRNEAWSEGSAAESRVRIARQRDFSDADRRDAANTLNVHGWEPSQGQAGISFTLEPFDPYPSRLERAVIDHDHDVEIWDNHPGEHRLYYVVLDGAEPDFSLLDILSPVPPRFPREVNRDFLSHAIRAYEDYFPQFMPYTGASAIPLGEDTTEILENDEVHERYERARGNINIDSADDRRRYMLAAYIRKIQQQNADMLQPTDTVAVIVPRGFVDDANAFAFLNDARGDDVNARALLGDGPYHAGAVIIEDYEELGADEFAMTVVHEVAHDMGLGHHPGDAGDVDSAEGKKIDEISGWRMSLGGDDGWNKSSVDGNQQEPGTLISPMFPSVKPTSFIMFRGHEYGEIQQAIDDGLLP